MRPRASKKQQRLRQHGSRYNGHQCCHQHDYQIASEAAAKDSFEVTNPTPAQCCNFQHIVQLQDGTTRSVLCSNLNLAPVRLRSHVTKCQMGNGSCAVIGQQKANTCHNTSSNAATATESGNKMYSGPERII